MSRSPPSGDCESSEMLHTGHASPTTQPQSTELLDSPPEQKLSDEGGEDQALDSHQVIELQQFSERKAWIEEKIKFLENMPPIDVFAGLDSIRTSAEDVSGLPTREELRKWVHEHDTIEKETEMFDSGELKKLKSFTKAATQRNLSPEDTDLIELTLTTIYELDKLLHLLRDRSENLDLLGVRLTWEEQRAAAWRDRGQLVCDLESFLADRARWSPAAYNTVITNAEPSERPDSSASAGSDPSTSPSYSMSRSARFKLAELLSRDAATFVGRVASLRHAKISAAGKALDKLIENSRKPVPEELLDEQDKLEEKGIAEMEGVDKFVMNVVVQWRKADDIYAETMKDQSTARSLLEEIETAKLQHPQTRQSAAFSTHLDALKKRLHLRSASLSSTTCLPCPVHPLFPDQQSSNATLALDLSSENTTAIDLAKKVEVVAKEYRESCEGVRQVEARLQDANDLSTAFLSIINRFEKGVTTDHGDGSPPDISTEACLDPASHSVFLALLPSIKVDLVSTSDKADQVLRSAQTAFSILSQPGVDPVLKSNATSATEHLSALQQQARHLGDGVSATVGRLQEVRKIWSIMGDLLKELEDIRRHLGDAMEVHQWRPQSSNGETPSTPESPLSSQLTSTDSLSRLDDIEGRLSREIEQPLFQIAHSLELPLNTYLVQTFRGLTGLLDVDRQMARLLKAIKQQAEVMSTIRGEFEGLQMRIEEMKLSYDSTVQHVLASDMASQEPAATENDPQLAVNNLRDVVHQFTHNLSLRVPFVAPTGSRTRADGTFVKRRFSSGDLKLGAGLQQVPLEVPFDLYSLDDTVRADSNSYAMKLASELERLDQKANHLQLAHIAKKIDFALSSTVDDINTASQGLDSFKARLSAAPGPDSEMGRLQAFMTELEAFSQTQRTKIGPSFSPIRGLLRRVDCAPGAHDPAVHEVIYLARSRAVDDAELKFGSWNTDVDTFRNQLSQAQQREAKRLEQERISEERRVEEENERCTQERLRQERERLQAEEEARLTEEARLAAEARVAEENRLAEEARLVEENRLAEEARLVEENRLAEEARLVEENRLAEEARLAEETRLAEEARLAKETRLAEEARLAEQTRLVEEAQLAEEIRLAEEARVAEETRLAEKARLTEGHGGVTERERNAFKEAARPAPECERFEPESRMRVEQDRIVGEERLQEERRCQEQEEVLCVGEERSDEEREISGEIGAREPEELEHENGLLADEGRMAEEPGSQAEVSQMLQERLVQEHQTEKHPIHPDQDRSSAAVERMQHQSEPLLVPNLAFDETLVDEANKAPLFSISNDANLAGDMTHTSRTEIVEDVFGFFVAPSHSPQRPQETVDLHACIFALRKRLRSLNIGEILQPQLSSFQFPTQEQVSKLDAEFSALSMDVNRLLSSVHDPTYDLELRSFRSEMSASSLMISRVHDLSKFSNSVHLCDMALSDLLEHIDSFPASPVHALSTHVSQPNLSPEAHLAARLAFNKSLIDEMISQSTSISDDPRVENECGRVLQTWSELQEMGNDRVHGKKSRPPSVLSSGPNSSGRNSSASGASYRPVVRKHKTGYSVLSARPKSRGQFFVPSHPNSNAKRVTSGSTRDRPSSRVSNGASQRSVTSPLFSSSTLYKSTYASRQRTTSLTSNPPPTPNLSVRPPETPTTLRTHKRAGSPSLSDISSHSRSTKTPSRSSSTSTWARAPRPTFPSVPALSPPKPALKQKKAYIANPKSKLDVAVGDVVNKLPVNINIEVVADTWKDQSGKYWIGDEDPKLCFCRILRSQTVMVRVGGGWTELSKFIKDHFADVFCLVPDSPKHLGSHTEKWISSATLFEAPEIKESPPFPPSTPEPQGPRIPSFSLLTPNARSPQSLKSTPSSGSPLSSLQFIRRADADTLNRPTTPSKSSVDLFQRSLSRTPARNLAWRP